MSLAFHPGALWLTPSDQQLLSDFERLGGGKKKASQVEWQLWNTQHLAGGELGTAGYKEQGRWSFQLHAARSGSWSEDGAAPAFERRPVGSRSTGGSRRRVGCSAGGGAPNGTAVPTPNGSVDGFAVSKVLQGERLGSVQTQVMSGQVFTKGSTNGAAKTNGAARESTAAAAVEAGAKAPIMRKVEPVAEEALKGAVRASTPTKQSSKLEGFTSVEDALIDVKQGKMVVLVDPKHPGGVGNLFMAGALASETNLAFMVNYGSGLVFAPAAPALLDQLELPPMVEEDSVSRVPPLPFTVTIDLLKGTSTGISAADRALTIRHMASADAKPQDFRRPGHVIPLRSSAGGLLQQAGHAEAAVALAQLAGLPPVGVLCAVTNSDGSMASLEDLQLLARRNNFCLVSISDLVRHCKVHEKLVERTGSARLPTKWGEFAIYCYKSLADGIEHVAMVKGDIGDGEDILCRVHSECLTGDIFASERCDCGPQLDQAMERINQAGRGIVVYMRGHEGRGIGLGNKLQAYNLQDVGRDTVEANEDLGLPIDSREYRSSAQMLTDLGVRSLRLMTNNPAKFEALTSHGIEVKGRVPVLCPITMENMRYLETKRKKMGHVYASDIAGMFGRLPVEMPEESEH